MDTPRCPMCGALVPDCVESCRALFGEICAQEYSDPVMGMVHLLTVDAYALQHSEEHSPRSNAFHLMRLYRLLDRGGDPGLGQRPPREVGKAFEQRYDELPYLEPPQHRGDLTIVHVYDAPDRDGHADRVRQWARTVWEAYHVHHEWVRLNFDSAL
jgi:hypothetical protein